MFDDAKTRVLAGPLAPERVRPLTDSRGRPVLRDGKPVHYMEAWDLIEQANLIFGFGNWSRETVSITPIHEPVMRKHESDPTKDVVVASFWAKVRITVTDGARSIVREGCGAATAYQKVNGEAVEMAIKSAETDAMKRALITFGNQFGLALYDKERRNVGHDEPTPADRRHPINVGFGDVGAESGRALAHHTPHRTLESASPRPANSERALATLDNPPRPTGRSHANGNGGMRY